MNSEDTRRMLRTADAAMACALLAVDPEGLAGAVLKGPGGPARDDWLAALAGLLPERRVFRLPAHAGTDRLTGGLDVAATLRAGRPVHDQGLLAEAGGGLLLLTSAERLAVEKAALVAAALDGGARLAFVALDEGIEDEQAATILTGRAAFLIDLRDCDAPAFDAPDIGAARALYHMAHAPEEVAAALCQAAVALGIASLRPAILALRAARAAAALDGRETVTAEDAALAARLVLAPRATRLPAPAESGEEDPPPPPPPPDGDAASDDDPSEDDAPAPQDLASIVLEALKPALPEGLLAALERGLVQPASRAGAGAAVQKAGLTRGRPAGTRPGEPKNGARLSLIDTLRAAAPWQPLRRRQSPGRDGLIVVKPDLRVKRFRPRSETTAIFAVDASGSAALHRMAEAKGAVELLLADCYVRRDRVALIAFRGRAAELLLPPTRSLQRARKSLADLPGGGGTPLCAAIEQALLVASQVRRGGGTPLIVFLTDGKANIARDGTADRQIALRDAESAGQALARSGIRTLMIDMSEARGGPARKLAEAMGARFIALPHADAARIKASVGAAMASS